MFKRRLKGPRTYEEWDAALKLPLDFEHSAYLSAGTLKQKELYVSLFNRISDYVTGTFNTYAHALEGEKEGAEIVFELRRFLSRLKQLSFFRQLEFVRECDKAALTESLKSATGTIAARLEMRHGEAVDVKCETVRLKRAFGDNQ